MPVGRINAAAMALAEHDRQGKMELGGNVNRIAGKGGSERYVLVHCDLYVE